MNNNFFYNIFTIFQNLFEALAEAWDWLTTPWRIGFADPENIFQSILTNLFKLFGVEAGYVEIRPIAIIGVSLTFILVLVLIKKLIPVA